MSRQFTRESKGDFKQQRESKKSHNSDSMSESPFRQTSLSEINLSPIGPRPAPRKLETLNRSSTKREHNVDKENSVTPNIKK